MTDKFPINPTVSRTDEIVFSTRARFARNLADFPFPGVAAKSDAEQVLRILSAVLNLRGLDVTNLSKMDSLERQRLAEKWIISTELSDSQSPCGLARDDARGLYVMINEEDHLRIQCMRPGYDPAGVFATLKDFDVALGRELIYAYSKQFGFLTACPSNLGTGLRISVLIQLNGLKLTLGLEESLNAIDRLRFNIRGCYGEDSEKEGSVYQISNRETLGVTEEFTIGRFESVMKDLIRREHHARYRLLTEQRNLLKDAVVRALSILLYATHYPADAQVFEPLSMVRFGVALGVVKNLKLADMDRLALLTRFGHLVEHRPVSRRKGEDIDPRAEVAQDFLREKGFYEGIPPDFVTV